MNFKIVSIIILSLSIMHACSSINFQLHNSLPCTLYYALNDTSSQSFERPFILLEPYSTVQLDIKFTPQIKLSIAKDVPQAGQEVPLFILDISSKSSIIDIKTCQTKKGDVRIIPQRTALTNNTDKEQLPLPKPIDHHAIWITSTTYQPPRIVQTIQENSLTCSEGQPLQQLIPDEVKTDTLIQTVTPEQNIIPAQAIQLTELSNQEALACKDNICTINQKTSEATNNLEAHLQQPA